MPKLNNIGLMSDEIKENAELLALKADDLAEIKYHFGITEQVKKLKEEVLELDCELDKFFNSNSGLIDFNDLISEMADVQICIAQVVGSIGGEQYRKIFLNKISRTKMRIKSGYYGGTSDKVEGGHIGFDRCLAGE